MTRERITRLFWQVPHRAQAATAGRKTQRSKAHRTFVRVATRGAPPRIRRVFRFYCRCVLLGLGPCLYGTEQAWFTRAWLTTDGLPNNHVTAVAENADGELLVATRTGAARFDGVRFTPAEPPDADPDIFRSLRATTVAGEVWVVRNATIGVLRDGKFVAALTRQNARIAAARDGGLWIGSDANLAKRAPDGTVRECGQFEP